jgi:serine phosphatase RsbU (regulator of sigma subunit)
VKITQNPLRMSISAKLITGVSLLVGVIVISLSIATVLIFSADKMAYIFDYQNTQVILTGQQFQIVISDAKSSLNMILSNLKLSNNIQPRLPPEEKKTSAQSQAVISNVLNNQERILYASLYWLDPKTLTLVNECSLEKKTLPSGINFVDPQQQFALTADWIREMKDDLKNSGLAFLSFATPGLPPLLGIITLDKKNSSQDGKIPIALGIISLSGLAEENQDSRLTILNSHGWVLYDTDAATYYARGILSPEDDTATLFEAAKKSQVATGTLDFQSYQKSSTDKTIRLLGSYSNQDPIFVLSQIAWKKANQATYTLIEQFAVIGLMLAAFALIIAIIFSRTLTEPLKKLFEGTKQIMQGNFTVNVHSTSSDEVGALAGSFNAMSLKIAELIEESIAKTKIEGEIEIVSTVQKTLIPAETHSFENLEVRGLFQTAASCGGDWWGIFRIENKTILMIADATGHGLPSALITAAARSFFSMSEQLVINTYSQFQSPSQMLQYANRTIYDAAMGKILMSAFVCVIDTDAMTLTFANAGHNPPVILRKPPEGAYEAEYLVSSGNLLGLEPNANYPEDITFALEPDDFLFLYTDGLTEAKNKKDAMFGKKRLKSTLLSSIKEGPPAIMPGIVQAMQTFIEDRPLDDDLTIVCAWLCNLSNPRVLAQDSSQDLSQDPPINQPPAGQELESLPNTISTSEPSLASEVT